MDELRAEVARLRLNEERLLIETARLREMNAKLVGQLDSIRRIVADANDTWMIDLYTISKQLVDRE